MVEATIVEDAMAGYDIIATYDGKRFVAVARNDIGIVLRAVFHRGNVEAAFTENIVPMKQIVGRINEHLFKYTGVKLQLPGEMQSVSGLWPKSEQQVNYLMH